MATGGSTNAVLHLLAVAREAGVRLGLNDFDRISRKTPVLADLKPWGRSRLPRCTRPAAWRVVARRLLEAGLLHEEALTVTGRTIGEEVRGAREAPGQQVIRTRRRPASSRKAGSPSCFGNLAPEGCVASSSRDRRARRTGARHASSTARRTPSRAVKDGKIKAGDVIVIR